MKLELKMMGQFNINKDVLIQANEILPVDIFLREATRKYSDLEGQKMYDRCTRNSLCKN